MRARTRLPLLLLLAALTAPLRAANPMPTPTITSGSLVDWHLWKDHLVAAFNDNTIALYVLPTGQPASHFHVPFATPDRPYLTLSDNVDFLLARCTPAPLSGKQPPFTPFDLPSGASSAVLDRPAGEYIHGFDPTGHTAFALQWHDCHASAIRVETGETQWQIDFAHLLNDNTRIDSYPATYFLADGSAILLAFSDKLLALDPHGKILWQLQPPPGSSWTPVIPFTANILTTDILLSQGSTLLVKRTTDGSTRWTLSGIAPTSFRAFNPATNRIAYMNGNSLTVIDPAAPAKTLFTIPTTAAVEAQFTADGQWLVVGPALTKTGEHPNPRPMGPSPILARLNPTATIIHLTPKPESNTVPLPTRKAPPNPRPLLRLYSFYLLDVLPLFFDPVSF